MDKKVFKPIYYGTIQDIRYNEFVYDWLKYSKDIKGIKLGELSDKLEGMYFVSHGCQPRNLTTIWDALCSDIAYAFLALQAYGDIKIPFLMRMPFYWYIEHAATVAEKEGRTLENLKKQIS